MSHYAVAVFSDSPHGFDALLEPYAEDSHFTRHVMDETELRERYARFLEQNPSWAELGFDGWLEDSGYEREGDEIVAYYNDDSKWDWYTLGGRDYMFDPKPGEEPDENGHYRKNQIDFAQADPEETAAALKFWQDYVVDGKEPEGFVMYKREYYLDRYKTAEQYAKEMTGTRPYAFVTPDGVWHSPGTVGWFALDDSTDDSMNRYIEEWNAYISDLSVNPYVSMVDCHI